MTFSLRQRDRVLRHLNNFDFRRLFLDELGWDRPSLSPLAFSHEGQTITFTAVSQKRDFYLFIAETDDGNIPPATLRGKAETWLSRRNREHLIVFVDAAQTEQVWQWVRREPGQTLRRQYETYRPANGSGTRLLEKLNILKVSFADEEDTTLVDMVGRARAAFNVERATKKFYDRFKRERNAFESFVQGTTDSGDEDWYVSVMLNRLMFVYFIQKKGFLDGDLDYLRNRLQMVREQQGDDQFHSFYRYFLLRLFHDGLGKPPKKRLLDPTLEQLLGRIPYLNGGIFQLHEIEQRYPNIEIADEAFEQVLDFFDQYDWRLDDRPLRDDREINPDVLGYIFEKYINQKQMGAYYTKEDITEYISKNTIIPYLFDVAKAKCATAFVGEGAIWSLLQDDPDRYIYAAVQHGVTEELPPEIGVGIDDVSQRGAWNTPTPPTHGLPTEIWREAVARRQRYEELQAKLAASEVQSINDLITYNLDIKQFAQDVIEQSEGADLLNAFWQAINGVTVLDPTCGSGAFLFAALNILQPLYEACLDRMGQFLAEPGWVKLHPNYAKRFQKVQEQIAAHPNRTYFVLKSIMVNNLYGVDIMAEAVEICKLRLFLKLAAQVDKDDKRPNLGIEPLPDIDFNVRAGNTLVGFATYEEAKRAVQRKFDFDNVWVQIEEGAQDVDRLARRFRQQQTELGGEVTTADKQALRNRLAALEKILNRYLAQEYGVDPDDKVRYDQWLTSHQPFHWFTEFYGIVHNKNGFDVIIGNPPYVEYKQAKKDYELINFKTISCGNLYVYTVEQSNKIALNNGRIGMIIPLSAFCTDRMIPFIDFTKSTSNSLHIANFSWRPGKLFEGANLQLSIMMQTVGEISVSRCYTTKYILWESVARPQIFETLSFAVSSDVRLAGSIPKVGTYVAEQILKKIRSRSNEIGRSFVRKSNNRVYYRRGGLYWKVFIDIATGSNEEKIINVQKGVNRYAIIACLSSNLWFWYLMLTSDCRHLGNRDIDTFPFNPANMQLQLYKHLIELGEKYVVDLKSNSEKKVRNYRGKGAVDVISFYVKKSKPLIDEIDSILAQHFGFTPLELDYIVNYDIKYRMGSSLFESE